MAILATLLLGVLFMVVNIVTGHLNGSAYLVVIRYADEADAAVRAKLGSLGKYKLKSRSMNGSETEVVAEAKLSRKQMDSLAALLDEPGVTDVNIISYNGTTLL